MAILNISKALNQYCDVCNQRRGGPNHPDHTECSKIRKARGFPNLHAKPPGGTMVVPKPTVVDNMHLYKVTFTTGGTIHTTVFEEACIADAIQAYNTWADGLEIDLEYVSCEELK